MIGMCDPRSEILTHNKKLFPEKGLILRGGGGTHMLRHTGDVPLKWVTFSPKILRTFVPVVKKVLRGGSHFTRFEKKKG